MAADTARALLHDILGPIRPILAREDVTDLCINGPGFLFVEGRHGWERIQATKHCMVLAEKLLAAGDKGGAAKIYTALRNSRTECCVGLVLISPAEGM